MEFVAKYIMFIYIEREREIGRLTQKVSVNAFSS